MDVGGLQSTIQLDPPLCSSSTTLPSRYTMALLDLDFAIIRCPRSEVIWILECVGMLNALLRHPVFHVRQDTWAAGA